MIDTVIIDDEPLARSVILEYLESAPDYRVMAVCGDGFEGLKAIQQFKPDLVFLDIQMPRLNGFEMLELLEVRPVIIFTTAYDTYAIKAFEQHATDYLLKPFSKARFDTALVRAASTERQPKLSTLLETIASAPGQKDRIVVKTGSQILIIPVAEIDYFEADDDNVTVHTAKDSYLKNRTLTYFEQLLDPQVFIRVHRSYLLKVQEITRIDPYMKDSYLAVLRSGAQIPVSKSGYIRLKEKLGI